MLATSGDPPPPPSVRWMAPVGMLEEWTNSGPPSGALRLTPPLPCTGRQLLLVEVRLRFPNVYARSMRVRRASQVPQGRVPRGVHGKAR